MNIDRLGARFFGLALLATITGLAGVWAASAVKARPASMEVGASKIGLLNIEEVINKLAEVTAGQEVIKSRAQVRQQELFDLQNQITEKDKALDLVKLEDKNRRDLAVELMQLNATAQAKKQAYQAIIDVEKGDLYRDAHRHIMEACKRYAEKNGLELVLVDDRAIQIPPNVNGNEVTAIISQKRVLYGAPELDITSDILKSMNNDFEAGTNKITPAEKKPADKKQSDKSKKN